jgi:predicted MFS family arabinose efflux permease
VDHRPEPAGRRISAADALVLVTSMFGMILSVVYLYFMGVIVKPIERDLAWTRAETTAVLTLVSVISVIGAPIVGVWIDRYGTRLIGAAGTIVYCASISLLALTSNLQQWWIFWFFVGLGSLLVKPTVWLAAVAGRFSANRGLAMGIALCGAGIGAAIIPPITEALTMRFGWRGALFWWGVGSLVVMAPLLAFCFAPPPKAERPAAHRQTVPLSQLMRAPAFVKILIGGFLMNFSVMALGVHLVPMLEDFGAPGPAAVRIAFLMGIISTLMRPLSGIIMDRSRSSAFGAAMFALPVVVILVLNLGEGQVMLYVAAVVLGIAMGSEVDILAYFVSKYLGANNYGSNFGAIMGVMSLGVGLGPAAAGFLYTATGGYATVLWALAPLFLSGAAVIASLGRYPDAPLRD